MVCSRSYCMWMLLADTVNFLWLLYIGTHQAEREIYIYRKRDRERERERDDCFAYCILPLLVSFCLFYTVVSSKTARSLIVAMAGHIYCLLNCQIF